MKMIKKSTLWIICGVLATNSLAARTKPNIVMFYIDDWAWNGSPVAMDDSMENSRMPVLQMPNIEKLAVGRGFWPGNFWGLAGQVREVLIAGKVAGR